MSKKKKKKTTHCEGKGKFYSNLGWVQLSSNAHMYWARYEINM